MLHTIAHSATYFDTAAFLDLLAATDVVLLWQDGVILSIEGNAILTLLQKKNIPVFALIADINARGLCTLCSHYVKPVSLQQCIGLTAQHKPQLAW